MNLLEVSLLKFKRHQQKIPNQWLFGNEKTLKTLTSQKSNKIFAGNDHKIYLNKKVNAD